MYIARVYSRVSRLPVSAGGPVPSPGQAAAAAPQQCCQAPTCHTNDACGRREQAPQQTGGRGSCSAAQASARRISAAQQCSSMQARGGLTLSLLVVCAMTAERQIQIRKQIRKPIVHSLLGFWFYDPPEGLLALAPHECICTTCPPHCDAINVVDCTQLITRLAGRALGALASRRWCGAVRTSWWQPCASSRPLPRSFERWL